MKASTGKKNKPSVEFERFRDAVRCILAVPKKEIDKQKAEYERKKTKRKTVS